MLSPLRLFILQRRQTALRLQHVRDVLWRYAVVGAMVYALHVKIHRRVFLWPSIRVHLVPHVLGSLAVQFVFHSQGFRVNGAIQVVLRGLHLQAP